jgi:hypothetical protein
VSAEINPNDSAANADASYLWQYGTTAAYGTSTASSALTAGTSYQSASASLSLTEPCVYHFRVVAGNAFGSTDGSDHTVTSTDTTTDRINESAPVISGTAAIGDELSAAPGTWSGGYDCGDTTYQWERSSAPSGSAWTPISGATATDYTPVAADAGQYLAVVVTETNSAGAVSASSAPTAEVPSPAVPPPSSTTPTTTTPTPTATPTTTTTATPTPTSTSTSSTSAPKSSSTVRFYRCARTCSLLNTHGARTYTPKRADWGRYIKVVTTVSRIAGGDRIATTSTRWVGPVSSATAGSIALGDGARVASLTTVRGSSDRALAQVRVSRRSATRLALVVQRRSTARTQVWAYVVANGRVVSCTAARSLTQPATLSFALKRGQTIRLVAVTT